MDETPVVTVQPDMQAAPIEPPPAPSSSSVVPQDAPETPSDEIEQITAKALRHIRAKRGGDLVAVLLVGSALRNELRPHSDLNYLVLVKGTEMRQELVKIQHRFIEIRYVGLASVEELLKNSLRLPLFLRKARILFDYEKNGSQFLEQVQARFRQGPPPLSFHDRIRIRTETLHWLGKAEDVGSTAPASARHLLSIYLDESINAFYQLRGYWLGLPDESLPFINQRDPALGDLFQRAFTAPDLGTQLDLARQIGAYLFKEIPLPARID